jgi:hypothetical protein
MTPNEWRINLAKLSALRAGLAALLNDEFVQKGQRPLAAFSPDQCGSLLTRVEHVMGALVRDAEEFRDMPVHRAKPTHPAAGTLWYSRECIERSLRDIEYVLSVASAINHHGTGAASVAVASIVSEPKRTVFITHGRSRLWLEVQPYIERDVGLKTIELAQQPNLGRHLLIKLDEESRKCDSAVIVMTGDDLTADGDVIARQNVMHEIGFFQARLGLSRVCLLHEEGVGIPSNLHGLVYVAFPKDRISAGFAELHRELKAMYSN